MEDGWISESAPVNEPGKVETTLWWGDRSIDREASAGGIEQWCLTGETDHLLTVAGVKPKEIKWRALSGPEIPLLPRMGFEGWVQANCYMAARIGLLGIEGVSMRSGDRGGFPIWTRQSINDLSKQTAIIPMMKLHSEWIERRWPQMVTPEENRKGLVEVDFPQWIGGLILRSTFRSK